MKLLKITADETSDFPTLGSYFQALALMDLGESERADSILADLEETAQALLEGESEAYRWESPELQKALGLYYMSLLEEHSGDGPQAQAHREQASALEPTIERQAIIVAQRVYARAHQ